MRCPDSHLAQTFERKPRRRENATCERGPRTARNTLRHRSRVRTGRCPVGIRSNAARALRGGERTLRRRAPAFGCSRRDSVPKPTCRTSARGMPRLGPPAHGGFSQATAVLHRHSLRTPFSTNSVKRTWSSVGVSGVDERSDERRDPLGRSDSDAPVSEWMTLSFEPAATANRGGSHSRVEARMACAEPRRAHAR